MFILWAKGLLFGGPYLWLHIGSTRDDFKGISFEMHLQRVLSFGLGQSSKALMVSQVSRALYQDRQGCEAKSCVCSQAVF